jgi:hypothetical protein
MIIWTLQGLGAIHKPIPPHCPLIMVKVCLCRYFL